MKKLFTLLVAFSVVSASVNAQEVNFKSKRGENILPEKGDWAISFNADGLFKVIANAFKDGNNSQDMNFTNNYVGKFVGKKFCGEKQACRYIANLEVSTTKLNTGKDSSSSASAFKMEVGLGKEWRRGKTRLQGFYGIDGLVGVHTNNTKVVNGIDVTKHKNPFGLDVSALGFIGAEFFVFPKVSLGAQYQYGLSLSITPKDKTYNNGTPETNERSGSTSFGLGGVGVASMIVTAHF